MSVYRWLVVTCWERADLLALVCDVELCVCHFPMWYLGQVWYLIVSIPDLCHLSHFTKSQTSKAFFVRANMGHGATMSSRIQTSHLSYRD